MGTTIHYNISLKYAVQKFTKLKAETLKNNEVR